MREHTALNGKRYRLVEWFRELVGRRNEAVVGEEPDGLLAYDQLILRLGRLPSESDAGEYDTEPTFAVFDISYDDVSVRLLADPLSLQEQVDPFALITRQECDEETRRRRAEYLTGDEQWERAQYLRLKAKYEPQASTGTDEEQT